MDAAAVIEEADLDVLVREPERLDRWYASNGVYTKPHVLQLPTAEQVVMALRQPGGREHLVEVLQKRQGAIMAMAQDPLRQGHRYPAWHDADRLLTLRRELVILGGNRSTKSEYAACHAVEDLVKNPGHEWAFFHSSVDSSIRQQQGRVYGYLPPEWRDVGKQGKSIYVAYTEQNGFSQGAFILPNGSKAYFFNYQQEHKVFEGYEFDGVWADELVPLALIEALRFRLVTRNGVLIVTFTPVEGYTTTVGEYVAGAKLIETRPSKYLPGENVRDVPKGEMPYILECANGKGHCLFFFTEWNDFSSRSAFEELLVGKPKTFVALRGYGWTEKTTGNAFPKFSSKVHVLARTGPPPVGPVPPRPWKEVYPKLPADGTNYVCSDPGVTKNWMILWFRVGPELEWVYIYREWPDWQTFGPWALPSDKPDGKIGPAQRQGFGRGIREYKENILMLEGWTWDEEKGEWDGSKAEDICMRLIDPRLGGQEVPTEEEGTSLIEMMGEEQTDNEHRIIGPSMVWYAAPGRIPEGLQLINDRLAYDERKPVSILNAPRLYVAEDCWQTIYALKEYTGADGEKGALKDVIDPMRYFFKSGLGYVAPGSMETVGLGSY